MSDYRIRQNITTMQGMLHNISGYADNPTAWQRLMPDRQAVMLNHYRKALRLRHSDEWPVKRAPGLIELRDEVSKLTTQLNVPWDQQEHYTPPTAVSYTHLTLPTKRIV